MQTNILNFGPDELEIPEFETVLTFRPFLDHIKALKEKTTGYKKYFFDHIIKKFEERHELLDNVDVTNLESQSELLELIYNSLTGITDDEDINYWALSLPLQPTVFYSTNAFFTVLRSITIANSDKRVQLQGNIRLGGDPAEVIYSVILEKCYGIDSFFQRDILHSLNDKHSGLVHYYRVNLDTRFIRIYPSKQLPLFGMEMIQTDLYNKEQTISLLQKMLPMSMFRIEGFGILTITDVSVRYAIENIKNQILNQSSYKIENSFSNVINWLKVIVGNVDIEFGLLPMLQINGKLIFHDGLYINSILVKAARNYGMEEDKYLALIDHFFANPGLIFFSSITPANVENYEYLKMIKANGIESYALIPVYFGNSLAGVLEIYSEKSVLLNEFMLSRLDPVIPLISQLMKNSIHEFHEDIEQIIQEKFTSLQPAVEWRFKEAAWNYIKKTQLTNDRVEIDDICFANVYPLYGAIDIRNSTIERNEALYKDLKILFAVLIEILHKLKHTSAFMLIEEKIFLCGHWLAEIENRVSFSEDGGVKDFLENDIEPFLIHFRNENPETKSILEEYFLAKDEEKGIATENRRKLELSMNTIISYVNGYLENMKMEVQQLYPCYFEKLKTDGVEYDIYIGQSISTTKPFNDVYLKNLRLLQLSSMATIAKYAKTLSMQMPRQVETTQLIFIHSQAIDIKFRKDEKRFDVEGAYNIRYHIVKKRIDKVLIKDTDKRLTQPGKIAMVYFNSHEANEYMGYIKYLQEQNILCDDLEKLELEDLQGVNGLKALRVGVLIENVR